MSAFEYSFAGHSFRVETAYSVIPHGEFVDFFRTCVGELRSAGLVAPEGERAGSMGAGCAPGAGGGWQSGSVGGSSYFDGGGTGFGGSSFAGQRDSARVRSGFRGGRAGFFFRSRTWRDDNRGAEQLCQGDDVVTGGLSAAKPGVASRGPNYERNKADRERKKAAKAARNKLSEERLQAQDELAVLEARRKIDVLKARDVEQEKRADRVRIQRAVERDMVAIEKTHAMLRATGNVPGEMGHCETIIGSGSISPDSSASQADVRAMMKELADSKKELEDGRAENANLRALLDKHGIAAVDLSLYDKQTWTQNEENYELLDQLYPGGYALNDLYASDGKARVVPC